MQCKLSLQSRDNSGVSFAVHFKKGLFLLNFCCSFLSSCSSHIFIPLLLSPDYNLQLFFICWSYHSFLFFLSWAALISFHLFFHLLFLILGFVGSFFCLLFVCVFLFFPLLLMHFKLVKKKKIQSVFCLCIFFLTWFFFLLILSSSVSKIKLQ